MNTKAELNGHFNANESRALISVIAEIRDLRHNLARIGHSIEITTQYEDFLASSESFLSSSGGSAIPDDFTPLQIEQFKPVFHDHQSSVRLKDREHKARLNLIGEGAYAKVFSFKDPEYGTKFALKRAKRDLTSHELMRFRQEFEIMSKLKNPYVLSVFKFDETTRSYTMEYCETTVAKLIERRNSTLSPSWRKRLALQLLYGMMYLHRKDILHRDLSANNLLLKEYEYGVVALKLADFGLAKSSHSTLTRTHSSIKGTIIDPSIDDFRDYSVKHEIYALGHVLNFIFTGRRGLIEDDPHITPIIERCTTSKLTDRYENVAEIVEDVEALAIEAAAIN